MRAGLQSFLNFLRTIFICKSNSEMSDTVENNEFEMDRQKLQSPVKETATMLSRTPKGNIVYDRDPLTPIVPPTFHSKSGVLLSDDVFNRNSTVLSEKAIACENFPQPSLHQLSLGLNDRSNLFMDFPLQATEKTINQFKWQQELLLMRNTNQLEETTPVYNISNHMIMQLFELKEAQRVSMASNFMKKIEDFEEASRQNADEECQRKKLELQERLVPKTESQMDVEVTIQRLKEEARLRRQLKEDQIDRKLKEMQTIHEREQQEDLRRRTLDLQSIESKKRKSICIEKVESLLLNFNQSMNSCLEKELFLRTAQTKIDRVSALKAQFEIVVNQENSDDPLVSAVRSENILKQIEDLVSVVGQDIAKNNTMIQEKLASAERQSVTTLPSSVPTTSSSAPQQNETNQLRQQILEKPTNKKAEEEPLDIVQKDDLILYTQIQSELRQYEVSASAFSSDPSLKTLRFDLQKAVVHPVNEISDQSGQHLLDKLERLRSLLQGNPVIVGTKRVRATEHPGGLEYCTNLLARRMVQQGEDQVNVNPKAAFPIAAVIAELWLEFPLFGRLVLAHFYRQCPYLVPYYVPQQEGQSNEDYYKSLGYRYTGGKVEQQPAYLKRMSGVVRLYAAVMISLPRRQQPHPHGLDQAWRYLAALLNLPPRNEITAAILVEFLTVTGHAMTREYGKQFQKMLHLICTDYFVMIRNVTPKGSGGGPVTRLQEFLHESITKGGIAPPAGQLPPRFW